MRQRLTRNLASRCSFYSSIIQNESFDDSQSRGGTLSGIFTVHPPDVKVYSPLSDEEMEALGELQPARIVKMTNVWKMM